MELGIRQHTTTISERPAESLFHKLYSIVPMACLFTSLSWSPEKQGQCSNSDQLSSQSCQQTQCVSRISNEFPPHSNHQSNGPPSHSDYQSNGSQSHSDHQSNGPQSHSEHQSHMFGH